MTYTPNTWATGDTITAEKLNNMEQGIANAGNVLIVNADNDGILDKTWQEISDAGFSVLYTQDGSQLLQIYCAENNGEYMVSYWTFEMESASVFIASSASSYPEFSLM